MKRYDKVKVICGSKEEFCSVCSNSHLKKLQNRSSLCPLWVGVGVASSQLHFKQKQTEYIELLYTQHIEWKSVLLKKTLNTVNCIPHCFRKFQTIFHHDQYSF